MNMVGVYVQPDGGYHWEYKEAGRLAWAAFHAKNILWNAPGQLLNKLRVLHLTVFASFACTAGTRQWTAAELEGRRTLQVRRARRPLAATRPGAPGVGRNKLGDLLEARQGIGRLLPCGGEAQDTWNQATSCYAGLFAPSTTEPNMATRATASHWNRC